MDDVTTEAFYELMAHAAHEHGKSVLMVTHDPDSVKNIWTETSTLPETKTENLNALKSMATLMQK